jgi:hypothetical protein
VLGFSTVFNRNPRTPCNDCTPQVRLLKGGQWVRNAAKISRQKRFDSATCKAGAEVCAGHGVDRRKHSSNPRRTMENPHTPDEQKMLQAQVNLRVHETEKQLRSIMFLSILKKTEIANRVSSGFLVTSGAIASLLCPIWRSWTLLFQRAFRCIFSTVS